MKIIYVLSAISGCGKTTYANKLSELCVRDNVTHKVCSADHFFTDTFGKYTFDRTKLGLAHQSCKDKCELLCQLAVNLPIIDNTSLTYQEISPYCSIAEKYGYKIAITRLESDLTDEELAARNRHGVPVEAITRMRNKMEKMESITAKLYEKFGKILVESPYYKEI